MNIELLILDEDFHSCAQNIQALFLSLSKEAAKITKDSF